MYASREYLEAPDIAVLANGYYNEMRKLIIEKVGEPVRIIDQTFEPYIFNEQKVLVIPTGGLSGLSHSTIFKNKISEYVQNGGIVICLSQQYGYDFNALPGDHISAYGWQEDTSCHAKAAYIENFHQILSSQSELYPDIKLDGYFTDYPDNAVVLLRRSKNQMPAMLMYSFGKGSVITASIYSDWGYLNGQASSSEISLVRDMLRWAKHGKDLPVYKTGEGFECPIQTTANFSKIEMLLKSPDNIVLERHIANEAVYNIGIALEKPGIYSVDYISYGADSKAMLPQSEGFYFSFSMPPAKAAQSNDFDFDITSDSENYICGNPAVFTFHIRNNTDRDEKVKCKATLSHHNMNFNDIVDVPAGKSISFDITIFTSLTDIMSSCFYSSGNKLIGKAERGISVFEPGLDIEMSADKEQYSPGETVSITADIKNKTSAALNILAILDIVDSSDKQIHYSSSEIKLAELGSWPLSQGFVMPEDVSNGTCKARLSAYSNSRLIGFKSAYFKGPSLLPEGGGGTENIADSYVSPGLNTDLTIDMEDDYTNAEPVSGSIAINNMGETIEEGTVDIRVFPAIGTWDLSGVVKDSSGAVIAGAKVNGIYANKDGKYKLEGLDCGSTIINIKAPWFDSASKDIQILPGSNILDINLTPSKYGNLSGVIENSIGLDIALEPANAAGSDASNRYAVTSGDGLYKFSYLPEGKYFLTALSAGISKDIQINEGENVFNDSLGQDIYQDFQEIEPNSAFTNATEINLNSRIHGKIYTAGDEDFFKFNIAEKGILYIKMYEVPQGLRPSIKIYDDKGRMFSMKGGSANENIVLETEFDKQGLYYLLVRDWYGNISSLNSYSLNFNFINMQDEYEPNDSIETARLIDFGMTYLATVAPKADADFYKISIPDAGKVTIHLKDMPSNIRPYMKLYMESGQVVDIKGSVSGKDVAMELEVANPSNYYFQVYDRYNSESSFLRYRILALYTPSDEYIVNDPAIYYKTENISDIKDEIKVNFGDISVSEEGKYYIEATLRSPVSQEIAKTVRAFYINERVPAALLKFSYIGDENISFYAGGKAEFRFNIANEGDLGGEYEVNFKYEDLINKTESGMLNADSSKEVAFEFLVPQDMESGDYEAEYKFKGETRKVKFNIQCTMVEVKAKPDGDVFKLNVKNKTHASEADGLSLFAEVRCGDYEDRKDFILDEEKDIEFIIPGLNNREKVYYGIYFESGKSLYLDSYLINGEKPAVPLIKIIKAGCDKGVYEDGEKVVLNWKVESDKICSVRLKAYLIKPDSNSEDIIDEEVILAEGMNEIEKSISFGLKMYGIYRIVYELEGIGQGSIFFDVTTGEKTKQNHEPVLLYIEGKEVIAWDILEFFVEAVDVDGDLLIYSAEGLPLGASFDPWLKRFYWRPGEKDAGDYTVKFIVSDGKTRASSEVKIIVLNLLPVIPDADIIAQPVSGIAPLEVNFNSQPVNKYVRIVKHEWDFDGKGVYDFSSLESGEAVHVYTGEGSFPAKMRVADRNGITNVRTVVINVERNPDSPLVYLNASPLKGMAPCKIFFEGGAFCPSGISRYEWDFDGDGVFEANSSVSGEIVKTYALPGKYNAEFRVIGADGLSGSKNVSIEIEDPRVLSVDPLVFPAAGKVPVEVNFKAEASGSNLIQKYQWDFEGDGIFDYTSLDSAAIKHTYCEPGVYAPTVRVTDSTNLSKQVSSEIRFSVSDPNDIKKGRIIINPKKGKAPLDSRFAFETKDEIGGAVEYLWDFNNDGVFDLITTEPRAGFIYCDSGAYMARLDIMSNKNIIMSCQEAVYVTSGKNDNKKLAEFPNNVSKDKICRIELLDRTSLTMPAGLLKKDDVVNIKKLESNQVHAQIDFSSNKSAGEYREYEFENSMEIFDKEMVISIPYTDENEDGIVDDKNIDELTLDAYWYDEDNKEWKILADSLIFPKENIVTVKTNHFTVFGIAGAEKQNENIPELGGPGQDNSDNGSGEGAGGGNCFIATAVFGSSKAEEVLILREFRDKYLLTSDIGKEFINLYYHFSPGVAEFIKHKIIIKSFIRTCLKFFVAFLKSIV